MTVKDTDRVSTSTRAPSDKCLAQSNTDDLSKDSQNSADSGRRGQRRVFLGTSVSRIEQHCSASG